MRNTNISDQVYEFGKCYVSFGFVDLMHLLWGKLLEDFKGQCPIKFYGFDKSSVVTFRSKIIYGAMKFLGEDRISTYSCLQIWFPSCWVGDTKKAFLVLIQDALGNRSKYDINDVEITLMQKWRVSETSISRAEHFFARPIESQACNEVWHMKLEVDWYAFCRHMFTGVIFAEEKQLVCGSPTMFTKFEGSMKFQGSSSSEQSI